MKTDEIYYVAEQPIPETPPAKAPPPPWKETNVIGNRISRVDAYERLTGSAIYPSDVILPNMLYGAVLRCPYPHAKIKTIDAAEAEKMPGIHAVISGFSSTPNPDWTYKSVESKIFDAHCRFEGDAVAAVAADTPYHAWDAVKKIKVEYERLPFVVDEVESAGSNTVKVHDDGNIVAVEEYQRGDIEKGFAEADVVLEEKYRTECEIHTPMELHGCVASWEGRYLTLWESTQGVYGVQSKVAEVLNLPLSRIRVIGHYMGGGFGSKLSAGKYTIIAALLAKRTARPVKLFLTREETYLSEGNRPPVNMTLKAGVKKDGTLTALKFSCIGASGAYPAGGTSLVDWLVRDLYLCPNIQSVMKDVYIHAGPARPFRAPGHPQGAWALEQMMDALAEAIQMDPVELRLKNIPAFSQGREGNPPYTSTGLQQCLEEGAKAFDWFSAREAVKNASSDATLKRGVGMAACLWFVGGGWPPSTVILKLFSDGSVNLNMGASDIGTGTKTVMAMVVAEELGVKPETIQIENADTGATQYATPSGGSKTVPTESPAVRDAAIKIKQQILEMAARELKSSPSELIYTGRKVISKSDASKSIRIVDIPELKNRGVIIGVGYRGPNPVNKTVNPFGAHFCEVEVNTRTGEFKILRFLGVHESGRVMNRITFDNQVFGGITMGIGLAATEMRVLDGKQTGKMLNRNWHDYKLPTALDVPAEMAGLPIEIDDTDANTTGAKGLGEPVTIPTAAAIANAVYHATGVRIPHTPINPMTLTQRLSQKREEK